MLRCRDGSYYTGITNDLERRLLAHRTGKASKYTRSRLPVRLACTLGAWATRGRALSEEARVKAMTRAQKRALIRAYLGVGRSATREGAEARAPARSGLAPRTRGPRKPPA